MVPRSKVRLVAAMMKAIHAQEDLKAAGEKAEAVIQRLKEMKLKEAAKKIEDSVQEILTHRLFPREHRKKIRSNNAIGGLNRKSEEGPERLVRFPTDTQP